MSVFLLAAFVIVIVIVIVAIAVASAAVLHFLLVLLVFDLVLFVVHCC